MQYVKRSKKTNNKSYKLKWVNCLYWNLPQIFFDQLLEIFDKYKDYAIEHKGNSAGI